MELDILKNLIGEHNNFVFVGEAGSGKSEVALNFAIWLNEIANGKTVHFFDMDMTKPLFRSRDVRETIEGYGIVFHYEVQFMDAPTVVGGVNQLLKDPDSYVVMDVGGDYIGARSVGGYAPKLNRNDTIVYYVLNAYRPWSNDIDHIDETLGKILGVSHIQLGKLHMINNPNNGVTTTKKEFIDGDKKMFDMVTPYIGVDFSCVQDTLYDQVKGQSQSPIFPIHLYLTYPWVQAEMMFPNGQPAPGRG